MNLHSFNHFRWQSKARVGLDEDHSTRISMSQSQPINVNINMAEKSTNGTTDLAPSAKTITP